MDQISNDPEIWKMAQERAGFKMHVTIFLIGIAFMWIVWAFIGYLYDWAYDHPWPVYPMLLWFLGLMLHYMFVYKWKKKLMVKEYEKLMKKKIK
jgi:hypothetical protein